MAESVEKKLFNSWHIREKNKFEIRTNKNCQTQEKGGERKKGFAK